jgi:hypothetical protein
MAYEEAFYYIVLGCAGAVIVGIGVFLRRASRRAGVDRPAEDA